MVRLRVTAVARGARMAKQFAKTLRLGGGRAQSPLPGSPEIADGPVARLRGPPGAGGSRRGHFRGLLPQPVPACGCCSYRGFGHFVSPSARVAANEGSWLQRATFALCHGLKTVLVLTPSCSAKPIPRADSVFAPQLVGLPSTRLAGVLWQPGDACRSAEFGSQCS